MNVVSLFDGMSCGMFALTRAKIGVNRYYASEVDKFAIEVSRANWGDAITHVGDVTRWEAWQDADFPLIDLIIGGSPCQDFSMAGKRAGMASSTEEVTSLERYLALKADGVEFEGQSYLFWEYVRILRHLQAKNPNILFFLENTPMAKKWEDVISEALGVVPVKINAALLSAQNRVRLYWTNIPFDRDIKDCGIKLIDVLDLKIPQDMLHSQKAIDYMANVSPVNGTCKWEWGYHSDSEKDKSSCVIAGFNKGQPNNVLIDRRIDVKIIGARQVGRKLDDNGKRDDDKSNCMTTVSKDSMVALVDGDFAPIIRRFTVNECCELQGLPIDYCASVSKSQAYKMIGNGWQVDVITRIFSGIKNPSPQPHHQPEIFHKPLDLFMEAI